MDNKKLNFLGLTISHEEFLIVLSPLGIVGVYALLALIGAARVPFDSDALMQWDTRWYHSIRVKGYLFVEGSQCNTAFFPLFPYLWKFSNLSVAGIAIVNAIFYGIGGLILKRALKLNSRLFWLLFLNPACCFMVFVYSEALFFLGMSMAIAGLKKDQFVLIVIGTSIACLTRSVSAFFVVGGLVAMLLTKERREKLFPNLLFVMTSIVCLGIVLLIQYYQTDVWMAFSKPQKHWGHFFRMPEFPLSIWNRRSFWMDGSSLAFAIVSTVYLIRKTFIERFNSSLGFIEILSFGYFTFFIMFVLFLQGGGLTSIGRYLFVSPFLWVVMSSLDWKGFKPFAITGIGIIVFLVFTVDNGVNAYMDHPGWVFRDLLFFSLFWFISCGAKLVETAKKWIWISVIVINVILFIHLMDNFLAGKWLG